MLLRYDPHLGYVWGPRRYFRGWINWRRQEDLFTGFTNFLREEPKVLQMLRDEFEQVKAGTITLQDYYRSIPPMYGLTQYLQPLMPLLFIYWEDNRIGYDDWLDAVETYPFRLPVGHLNNSHHRIVWPKFKPESTGDPEHQGVPDWYVRQQEGRMLAAMKKNSPRPE